MLESDVKSNRRENTISKIQTLFILPKKTDKQQTRLNHPKVFISHSPTDSVIASALICFFESLGIKSEHILSSSIPGYEILDDKFEALREELIDNKVFVVFILSDSYYCNPACCNEMGAAWILKKRFASVLIPGFSEESMQGVVKKNGHIIKLDEKAEIISAKLSTLKDQIITFFGLDEIPEPRWNKIKQHFYGDIKNDNEETGEFDSLLSELTNCSEFTVNTIINMGYDKNTAVMIINKLKNKDLIESKKFGRYSIKRN